MLPATGSRLWDTRVVVSGAGSVGSALALGLARQGIEVTLIESRRMGEPGRDRRRFVLSELSAQWLGRIGVTEALWPAVQPIHAIRVDEPGAPPVEFRAEEIGLPTLGYAVDASLLAQAFEHAVRKEPRIQLLDGARIRQRDDTHPVPSLEIERDSGATLTLSPRLLVVAEGQVSSLLERQGFRIRTRDSGQAALVIRLLGLSRVIPDQVSERLGPEGLLALLPESSSEATLTWTLGKDQADHFLAQPPVAQRHQVAHLLGWPPGTLDWREEPVRFDLIRHVVDPPYQAGIVVIGQAAHRIAPFAAQGMNLAFRDARSLIAALVEAEETGTDYGSYAWLEAYWRERRADHRRVSHLTEELPRLFALANPLARLARRSGWRLIQKVPSIRRSILRFGLGWRL